MPTLTTQTVALADISTNGYQRDRKDSHVDSIVNGFDITQWNLPKVVASRKGGYRVVLGQHRVEAARVLASTPAKWPFPTPVGEIECSVVHGLKTEEEEARLFLADDRNTKRLSPYDRHHAGLVAKEPRALDVQGAVDTVGIPIVHKQRHQNGKSLSAIGALNNVWGMGGRALLDETMAVVASWPDSDHKRTEGYLIGGLATVIAEGQTAGTWDRKKAIRRLTRAHNLPVNIYGEAMKIAAGTGLAFNSYHPYAAVLRKQIG